MHRGGKGSKYQHMFLIYRNSESKVHFTDEKTWLNHFWNLTLPVRDKDLKSSRNDGRTFFSLHCVPCQCSTLRVKRMGNIGRCLHSSIHFKASQVKSMTPVWFSSNLHTRASDESLCFSDPFSQTLLQGGLLAGLSFE